MTATRITLHNETAHTLSLTGSGASDEWTNAWAPPHSIAPFSTGGFRSEGDWATDGTSGHVEYAVSGAADPLEIHWNNPFIGLVRYSQMAPAMCGIYFEGGKGDNGHAHYHLISASRVAVPNYLPSRQGFRFSNSWPVGTPMKRIEMPDPFQDLPIGNAAWGLCGGMSMTSIDYFLAGQWAPTQTTPPSGPGDSLFDYIVNRQLDSLGNGAAWDFVKYSNPLYPDTDDLFLGDGRNWTMAHHSWPAIRRDIDQGRPCLLGVVTGDWTSPAHLGHQVVVYAYELSNSHLTLWVYDPNNPYYEPDQALRPSTAEDVRIEVDIAATHQTLLPIRHDLDLPGPPRISCFFPTPYSRSQPPLGRPPVPKIELSYTELALSDPSNVRRVAEHYDEGCMKGDYFHDVLAISQRYIVSASVTLVDQATISWTINGVPVSPGPQLLALPGVKGQIPLGFGGPMETVSDPVQVSAASNAWTLVFDVDARMGNFALDVSAVANQFSESTASIEIAVETSMFKPSPEWAQRFWECAGPLFIIPPEFKKLPSDPPWHDIFGPDFVPPATIVIPSTAPEWRREAAYRRRGQLDMMLSLLASGEVDRHRAEVASDLVKLFATDT